jgi:hypothetical protein
VTRMGMREMEVAAVKMADLQVAEAAEEGEQA